MPSGPDTALGAKGSDRRTERRYEVELHGELRYDGACVSVQVADISGSGALVLMEDPPEAGCEAELWIKEFGSVPVEVMHSGDHFCGVAIMHPAKHRDRLLDWLRQETASGGPAAAVR